AEGLLLVGHVADGRLDDRPVVPDLRAERVVEGEVDDFLLVVLEGLVEPGDGGLGGGRGGRAGLGGQRRGGGAGPGGAGHRGGSGGAEGLDEVAPREGAAAVLVLGTNRLCHAGISW